MFWEVHPWAEEAYLQIKEQYTKMSKKEVAITALFVLSAPVVFALLGGLVKSLLIDQDIDCTAFKKMWSHGQGDVFLDNMALGALCAFGVHLVVNPAVYKHLCARVVSSLYHQFTGRTIKQAAPTWNKD